MANLTIKDLVESKELSSSEMASVQGGLSLGPQGWDWLWEKPEYDYGYKYGYTVGNVDQNNTADVNISGFSLGNNVAVIGDGHINFDKVAPTATVTQTNKAFS